MQSRAIGDKTSMESMELFDGRFLLSIARSDFAFGVASENIKQSQHLASIDGKSAEQETAEHSTKIRAICAKIRANGVQCVRALSSQKKARARGAGASNF